MTFIAFYGRSLDRLTLMNEAASSHYCRLLRAEATFPRHVEHFVHHWLRLAGCFLIGGLHNEVRVGAATHYRGHSRAETASNNA